METRLENLARVIDGGAVLPELFRVVAEGDSMLPGIQPGDVVTVSKQDRVENGGLAVVVVRGEGALLKRVRYGDGCITLESDNKKYLPLVFMGAALQDVEIIGKPIELERPL